MFPNHHLNLTSYGQAGIRIEMPTLFAYAQYSLHEKV